MLKVNHLTCGYESGFAIRDINMDVKRGEMIAVIGPNGCGKTTLLRAITGALKPTAGSLLLQDQDMSKMSPREMARNIAVVSQNLEAAPMTVEDFVLLGRIPYFKRFQFMETEKDHEIARESMELTDSLRIKDHLVEQISGGELQLALIARALAQQPKLLLLDEPTSHLDITHQVKILDLIRRLNLKFKLTVLMVLHDLNLAAEYCHRLVLMSGGAIHKAGTPEEVLDYSVIEKVYNTLVVVDKNPLSSKPFVLIVSEEQRQKADSSNTKIAPH